MLQEHQIDPTEFCVAIAQWAASRRIPRAPNPASMCGEAGRTKWWWWREQHAEKWTGVPDVVRREAQASVADPKVQLAVVLRHRWHECKRWGARDAISLLWDPEVIWLLRLQEKAAQSVIADLLAQPDSEYAPAMREALRRIDQDLVTQRRLVRVWSQTIGPRHTLPEVVIPEGVVQRQTLLRALREEGAVLRAQERAQQHADAEAFRMRDLMARVRRHQMVRRAAP
jgi:hypothetical protein